MKLLHKEITKDKGLTWNDKLIKYGLEEDEISDRDGVIELIERDVSGDVLQQDFGNRRTARLDEEEFNEYLDNKLSKMTDEQLIEYYAKNRYK